MAIDKTSPELTEEQMDLFNKMTALQQRVCIELVKGSEQIDAYRTAKGKKEVNGNTAKACVSRMLTNANVVAFMDSIKRTKLNEAIMTREEGLLILSNMARTSTSDVIDFAQVVVEDAEGNKKAQTIWSIKDSAQHSPDKLACIHEVTAGKDGLKVKMHDQKTAIQMISRIEGWDKPSEADQVERQKTQEERVIELAAAVEVNNLLK